MQPTYISPVQPPRPNLGVNPYTTTTADSAEWLCVAVSNLIRAFESVLSFSNSFLSNISNKAPLTTCLKRKCAGQRHPANTLREEVYVSEAWARHPHSANSGREDVNKHMDRQWGPEGRNGHLVIKLRKCV